MLGSSTYQNHISWLIGQPQGGNIICIIFNKVIIGSQDDAISNGLGGSMYQWVPEAKLGKELFQ